MNPADILAIVDRSINAGSVAESAKLGKAIKANLPASRSAQREGGRGLGYGK
ncbi:MAG: hypothetical protein NTV46_01230 [Verrucomicrobia bacterium]|nr:hypothetical protein [Verrucomicrobiota bacterium]